MTSPPTNHSINSDPRPPEPGGGLESRSSRRLLLKSDDNYPLLCKKSFRNDFGQKLLTVWMYQLIWFSVKYNGYFFIFLTNCVECFFFFNLSIWLFLIIQEIRHLQILSKTSRLRLAVSLRYFLFTQENQKFQLRTNTYNILSRRSVLFPLT